MSGEAVIRVVGVQKHFGGISVAEDINLEILKGEILGLIGPNGAGKSTLLKILADVIPIQGGVRELGSNVFTGYFAYHYTDFRGMDCTCFPGIKWLQRSVGPEFFISESAMIAAAALAAGLGAPSLAHAQRVVAIAVNGPHPTLAQTEKGFREELVRQGFAEGKDMASEIIIKMANSRDRYGPT